MSAVEVHFMHLDHQNAVQDEFTKMMCRVPCVNEDITLKRGLFTVSQIAHVEDVNDPNAALIPVAIIRYK